MMIWCISVESHLTFKEFYKQCLKNVSGCSVTENAKFIKGLYKQFGHGKQVSNCLVVEAIWICLGFRNFGWLCNRGNVEWIAVSFFFFFFLFGPLIVFIVKLKLWDWIAYSYCEDPEGTSGPHGPTTCTWDLYPHPLPNPLYEIKLSKMKISIHLQSNLLSLISGYFWSFFAIPTS